MNTTEPIPLAGQPRSATGLYHLYVAGLGPQSVEAILDVRKAMQTFDADPDMLRIFDVHQHCGSLKGSGIRALPALVRISPEPRLVLLGEIRTTDRAFWKFAHPTVPTDGHRG